MMILPNYPINNNFALMPMIIAKHKLQYKLTILNFLIYANLYMLEKLIFFTYYSKIIYI